MSSRKTPFGVVSTMADASTSTPTAAVIKAADMNLDLQQDCVNCATAALQRYSKHTEIAAFIKKEFECDRANNGVCTEKNIDLYR